MVQGLASDNSSSALRRARRAIDGKRLLALVSCGTRTVSD
jgi:hypothetical protein